VRRSAVVLHLLPFLCCVAVVASAQNASAPAPAPEAPPWTLGGSLLVQPFVAYAADFSYGSSTTLSLAFKAGGGRARAEASLEAAVLTGASAALAWAVGIPYGRADDILVPSSPAGDYAVAARVRTLYARLDLDWISLTGGRQVINYGRGVLWSPTDIFTDLDLAGISPVRRGTDSLRVTVPLGETAGVDLVAAPTLAPGGGRYSGRLSALLGDVVDAAVVAARDGAGRANPSSTSAGWQLGADFKTDIEVGLTGEAVYFQPDAGGWGWVRAAGGLDWSVGDFILGAEYYYNGGGAAADPLFPGAHNASASVTWNASQLFRAALDVIANIEAHTGTATLVITVSAAQNADVTAFLRAGNDSATWSAQAGLGVEVKF
jgi:hypothetical protein